MVSRIKQLDFTVAAAALGIAVENVVPMLRTTESPPAVVWELWSVAQDISWNSLDDGKGIYGLLWGEGDGASLGSVGAEWMIVAVDKREVVYFDRRVKVPRCYVMAMGCHDYMINTLVNACPGHAVVHSNITVGACSTALVGDGGRAESGDNGQSLAGDSGKAYTGHKGFAKSGDYGKSTAGNFGTAISGDWGCSVVGDNGVAITGIGGVARAGKYGLASVGVDGVASVGLGGRIRAEWHDGERICTTEASAEQGTGVLPGESYRCLSGILLRV